MWKYNYSDELYHYGVKGMKWGVRRYQNKDGSLTSAGKKHYSDDSSENKKKGLTDKQKKYIKIGAAVVATALVAYGTYKFVDSGGYDRLVTKGKAALNGSSEYFKKDMSLARKDMSSNEIWEKVVLKINPDHGSMGTNNNCRRCTFAYEMSRRGFDVKATKTLKGTGQNVLGLYNATDPDGGKGLIGLFKRLMKDEPLAQRIANTATGLGEHKINNTEGSFAKSIFKTLSGFEDGSRGELTVKWNVGGAHSMAWEIIKGEPVIFDCQTGRRYTTRHDYKDFESLAKYIADAATTRLDNITLNDDFLLRWLKDA